MRSFLVVRVNSDTTFDHALATGADAIVLGLADTADAERSGGRRRVAALLRQTHGPARLFVRIGPLGSALTADDLDVVVSPHLDGIVLTGAAGGTDVARLSAMLRPREAAAGIADGTIRIVAMTDTAAGLLALPVYGRASTRLIGLGWDAAALSSDFGVPAGSGVTGRLSDALRLARSLTLAAAAAIGVAAVDTPFDPCGEIAGFDAEAREAREEGFTGKFAVSDEQVRAINLSFWPERRTGRRETVPTLT